MILSNDSRKERRYRRKKVCTGEKPWVKFFERGGGENQIGGGVEDKRRSSSKTRNQVWGRKRVGCRT